MRIKFLITAITIFMISISAFAQKEYQIEKVTVINYGDGRLLFRTNDDKEEPLNGKHRLIDGYRSEYVLAEFKDGMYHGDYQHFKNNKLKESAQYKEGRRHGATKTYFLDGETVENESYFKEGKPDGIFKTYNHEGKLISEKGYKNGLEHGVDKAYDAETGKVRREATYVEGKLDSKQTQTIGSGNGSYTVSSNNNNGQKDGEYIEKFEDGKIKTKGAYKAGKKNGRWETYKKDGLPEKVVTYRDDLRHGEYITYYTDGTVNEVFNYADDKKDGVCKEFYFRTGYPKGEYTYTKGIRNGPFKRYYDENNLKEEGRFENDAEVYIKTYYKDGKPESIKERKSGSMPWTYLQDLHSDGSNRMKSFNND